MVYNEYSAAKFGKNSLSLNKYLKPLVAFQIVTFILQSVKEYDEKKCVTTISNLLRRSGSSFARTQLQVFT